MKRGLTVPEIDARLAARRARGVKPTLYDARLVVRRGQLLADAEHEAYRELKAREIAAGQEAAAAARESATAKAAEVVSAWIEKSTELLEAAPHVSESDGRFIGEMLDSLASWFPLVGEGGDGEDADDAPVVFAFPTPGEGDVM